MSKTRRPVLISAIVLVWIALFVVRIISSTERPRPSDASSAHPAPIEIQQVEEVRDYRNWTRVNPQPVFMDAVVATDCAAPGTVRRGRLEGNPHSQKFITVYVNDAGRSAMIEQRAPVFPEGSVIVKEKLSALDSTTPELLTVMIKRAKGFNPASGDWEYMVTNGAGTEIDASGKLSSCQACHTPMNSNDYVFRSYLPDQVRNALR